MINHKKDNQYRKHLALSQGLSTDDEQTEVWKDRCRQSRRLVNLSATAKQTTNENSSCDCNCVQKSKYLDLNYRKIHRYQDKLKGSTQQLILNDPDLQRMSCMAGTVVEPFLVSSAQMQLHINAGRNQDSAEKTQPKLELCWVRLRNYPEALVIIIMLMINARKLSQTGSVTVIIWFVLAGHLITQSLQFW